MADYENTNPKQLGNLHERMKYLLELAKAHENEIPTEVWHAIFDLEIEVKNHKPAMPPYGRRLEPLANK